MREATGRDVAALAALHVETFRETHGGGPAVSVREEQWQRILSANDATDFTLVVEATANQLVGFARGTRHDGGVPGYQGVLNKIYVLRRFHRHGLGRLLVCDIARRFVNQGVTSMLLFGDARNPSNGFYEHLGAVRLLSPEGEFHGGYGWPDLSELIARHGARVRGASR
ncbi:MAG TPA: GNAT family N-acetyltransferase [Vicinamibacterales bacterium]|nr:GNAT family N-acetyltransferase [Vicinamibacterales bacterium]